jgi:hypothetical protein
MVVYFRIKKVFTNSIGMKFMLIPAGKFIMGIPPEEPGRKENEKQHKVNISKPFYLRPTEVSQAQWKKVMKVNIVCCAAVRGTAVCWNYIRHSATGTILTCAISIMVFELPGIFDYT